MINKKEIKQLVALLKKIDKPHEGLPKPIFKALTKVVPFTAFCSPGAMTSGGKAGIFRADYCVSGRASMNGSRRRPGKNWASTSKAASSSFPWTIPKARAFTIFHWSSCAPPPWLRPTASISKKCPRISWKSTRNCGIRLKALNNKKGQKKTCLELSHFRDLKAILFLSRIVA